MGEIREIIGNTTATPNPHPDWLIDDATKAGFIKNKPNIYTKEEIDAMFGSYVNDIANLIGGEALADTGTK